VTDWVPTPAAEVDSIIAAVADPLLVAAGFCAGARRRWVRSFPPVRHVFELASMKGATLAPRWGVSLDFVPHVKGNALAWHRTDKSAILDLAYDPIDFEPDAERRWGLGTMHGAKELRRDAERVLPMAIERALSWLADARELPSVLARAEWLRTTDRPGNRFGFENWVQQPLAYAFLLARTGDVEAGLRALDRWIVRNEHESLREKLVALLAG